MGLGILLSRKSSLNLSYFADKETKIKFNSQEKNMLAVFSLVIVFSIIEIALSVASAKSCDIGRDPQEERQVF